MIGNMFCYSLLGLLSSVFANTGVFHEQYNRVYENLFLHILLQSVYYQNIFLKIWELIYRHRRQKYYICELIKNYIKIEL